MSMPPHARNLWVTGAAAVVRLAAWHLDATAPLYTPEAPRIGCIFKLPQILERNTRVSEKSRESLATFYSMSAIP
ncbi:hypothetical protein C8R47DRAFT_1146907 [Mycena vitilis]|nr:hypothetical protein C8R47DRAFT_1146907 [Mycena vitilis]